MSLSGFKFTSGTAIAALSLILVLGFASPVPAQTVETREVIVTSTRQQRDLSEIPISVGVKSDEDIRRNPGLNLADYLSDIPGVQIDDGSMPGGKRIMIRGESPQRSLILIDGVKISEQKSMNGAAILMDASQIERIEVIKGPASVLYGSEAIGGVINIITKKGGDKPIGFSLSATGDSSVHGLEVRSAIFGEYNGFNYRFSASGLDAGERRTPNGSISHSEFQNRSFAGRIGYDWGDGEAWLKADAFLGRIHIPSSEPPQGQILYQRTPTAPKTVLNSRSVVTLDLPQWDRWGLAGGFELRNLTPYLTKIKFEAYFQNLKKDFYNTVFVNSWTGPIIIRNTINMHTFNDQDSYGGLLQTDWTFGDHQLIFGADYNRDEITALDERPGNIIFTQMPNTAPPPPFTTTTIRTPYSSFTYRAVQSHLGLFLQDEWKITPDFTATLGIRETWVTSDLQDDGNNPLLRKSKISDSKPVGNIGLVYSGFNDVALRAVWSQGYRFPPLNALYFGTIHGSANATYPNPNLKPETSNNFELGMRFGEGNLNFDIGAFVNMSKNYITVLPEGSINRYTNTDQAQTIGLELALSYNIPETGFTPYTSTTFLRRKFTNTITTQPRYRATERVRYSTYDVGQPNLFGRVGVKFQHEFDNNFLFLSDVYLDWAIKSQQYYYDSDNLHDFAGTGLPADLDYGFVTDESPAWTTFNLALGLEWGTDHRWNATLALKNIFDRDYKIATNVIEEPGFHIVAGVGFEF